MRQTLHRSLRIVAVVALLGAGPALAAEKLLAQYRTLTTAGAQRAAQAAFDHCQKQGYTIAVAVVDRAGQPLALLRDQAAGAHTVTTAINKAATALSFRVDTAELAATTQAGKAQSGIRQLPNVVAVGGGLLIEAKGGMVGAIGVSGAPGGDADVVCAKAGIAAISDALEFE